jgi:ATP-binding cassette subfamily B protein RaxB
LSFEISHGQLVLLTGESGIGKSTLIKLIAGVLRPTSGCVYVYGNDTTRFDMHPSICASVFQDDRLFAGTIIGNVAPGGQPEDSDERVWEVLSRCGLAKFIRSLPMGLKTSLGELGSSLSGGQVQRLLLARAIFATPMLLLLDEATSNLDEANERLVMKAISGNAGTRFFASHSKRLERYADLILEVGESGQVREKNPTRSLITGKPKTHIRSVESSQATVS